jgi:hypothetical protein
MAWQAPLRSHRRTRPDRGPGRGHRRPWHRGIRRGFARLHTSRILRLSEDLPVVVEVVDRPEAIDRILPRLDEMVGEGMLTVEKVHIIAYRGKAKN